MKKIMTIVLIAAVIATGSIYFILDSRVMSQGWRSENQEL